MLNGFQQCANCGQLTYHSQEILSDGHRMREYNDGNCIMLLCHECLLPTTWYISDDDLINLRTMDEQLRAYDSMLTNDESRKNFIEDQGPEETISPRHLRMPKPWGLKPNHKYTDSNGYEYMTDENGTLHRLGKILSKKARHRLEVKQKCAR